VNVVAAEIPCGGGFADRHFEQVSGRLAQLMSRGRVGESELVNSGEISGEMSSGNRAGFGGRLAVWPKRTPTSRI
jgi:hypothetical protein